MDTLRQQIEYYRARASEYDEWFYRKRRYDHGQELNSRWFDEVEICMSRLNSLGPVGTALELAAGTGIWTRELAKITGHVTALDASPEVLEINRLKLESPAGVTYRQEDIFAWEPTRQYDLVSFTFWLSHVPTDLAAAFLTKVFRATKPGGIVWMVDSRRAQTGTAADQSVTNEDIYQKRTLNDGRSFEIVKIYYDVPTLTELFTAAGFLTDVRQTESYFLHVVATKPIAGYGG